MALPGNPTLPSSEETLAQLAAQDPTDQRFAVADFFKRPSTSDFTLDSKGERLLYRKRNEKGKLDVWLRDLKTGQERCILEEHDQVIQDSFFARNSHHILFHQDTHGDERYHLFRLDPDTGEVVDLTPFKKVRAMGVQFTKDGHYIILMNKRLRILVEPWLLNIETGELRCLYKNIRLWRPIIEFHFDDDGVRAFTAIKGRKKTLYYKIDEQFVCVRKDNFMDIFEIDCFNTAWSPYGAFVMSNINSPTMRLEYWDLAKNECLRVVCEHPNYDFYSYSFNKETHELDMARFLTDRFEVLQMSADYERVYRLLEARFCELLHNEMGAVNPRDLMIFFRRNTKRDNIIVQLKSDRIAERNYLFNQNTGELTLLGDEKPHLPPAELARMHPISYTSRDGLTIHAYLTLPPSVEGLDAASAQKIPLVVFPHGGPHGVRDVWEFNAEAQLFASRGYATLQPNMRGSGGYGMPFQLAGCGEVGHKMIEDIEDGVDYVLAHYPLDPKRVAMYGCSYGGYAVLRSLVKTPDKFCCGVDYSGPANIFYLLKHIPPEWYPVLPMIKRYWFDRKDKKQQGRIREASPFFSVDKINKPLFVIHGANDRRVPIQEADNLVSALRARGLQVPYMVKYNEGHVFEKEANLLELYTCTIGFLTEHFQTPR